MLVLTRKSGQSLTIGEAKLTLIVKGDSVKVCIEADRSIPVRRSELQPKAGAK